MRILPLLLTASFAVLAVPAFAQSTPEFEGKATIPPIAEADRALDDVEVKSEPLLVVEEDGAPRSFIADDADYFGVASHSSSGADATVPASSAVLEAVAAARAAPKAQSSEVPAQTVFGSDDRVRITDATSYPFRAVGYLSSEYAGDYWGCTATLIGPRTLLTAAHCVWNPERGGWPDSVSFAPGANAPDTAPFGSFAYDSIYVVSGFIDFYHPPGYSMDAVQSDLAVVTLQYRLGDDMGFFGFMTDGPETYDAHLLGYPADLPRKTMWRADCPIYAEEKRDNYLSHHCDTYQGTSGGAMYWVNPDGRRYARAVNVGTATENNWALRLSPAYYQWVLERRQ